MTDKIIKKLNNTSFLDKLIWVCIFFYGVLFSYLSIAEHLGLKSNMNDLGGYDQALYMSLNGDFVRNSSFFVAEGQVNPNYFAKHSFYTIVLLIPLYMIYSDPAVLVILQSFLVALGALPLYWLGKEFFGDGKHKWITVVIPIIYLFNFQLHDAVLFDFHPVVALVPAIIFAFYYLYKRKYSYFSVFAMLISLSKEELPLLVFFFGLYILFIQKKKKLGLAVSLISLLYFFVNLKFLMPYFSGGTESRLVQSRFSHLGGDILSIIYNLVSDPVHTLRLLFTPLNIGYLISLLLPVLFLPLLSPEVLLVASPLVLINILSKAHIMHYPMENYWSTPIVAMVYTSALVSLKKLRDNKYLNYHNLLLWTSLSTLVLFVFLSPAPFSVSSSWQDFKISEHSKQIKKIAAMLPEEASVSVQHNIGPHISQRPDIYTFPYYSDRADYVVLDVTDPNQIFQELRLTRTFSYNTQLYLGAYYESTKEVFDDPEYGVLYFDDGYIVFKRGQEDQKDLLAEKMFEERFDTIFKTYIN